MCIFLWFDCEHPCCPLSRAYSVRVCVIVCVCCLCVLVCVCCVWVCVCVCVACCVIVCGILTAALVLLVRWEAVFICGVNKTVPEPECDQRAAVSQSRNQPYSINSLCLRRNDHPAPLHYSLWPWAGGGWPQD